MDAISGSEENSPAKGLTMKKIESKVPWKAAL